MPMSCSRSTLLGYKAPDAGEMLNDLKRSGRHCVNVSPHFFKQCVVDQAVFFKSDQRSSELYP